MSQTWNHHWLDLCVGSHGGLCVGSHGGLCVGSHGGLYVGSPSEVAQSFSYRSLVYVCVYTCSCVYLNMHVEAKGCYQMSSSPSTLFRRTMSLADPAYWAVSSRDVSLCRSSPTVLGLQTYAAMPDIYMGAEDLNSGP